MTANEKSAKFSPRVLVAVVIAALIVVGGAIAAVIQLTNRGPAVGTTEFDKQSLCQIAAELDDAQIEEIKLVNHEFWLLSSVEALAAIIEIQDDSWTETAELLAVTRYIADDDLAQALTKVRQKCETDGFKFASGDPDLAANTACAYIDYIDGLPASDIKSLAENQADLRRLAVTSSLFSADYLIRDEVEGEFDVTKLRGNQIVAALQAFDDDALQNAALPEVRTYCESR